VLDLDGVEAKICQPFAFEQVVPLPVPAVRSRGRYCQVSPSHSDVQAPLLTEERKIEEVSRGPGSLRFRATQIMKTPALPQPLALQRLEQAILEGVPANNSLISAARERRASVVGMKRRRRPFG